MAPGRSRKAQNLQAFGGNDYPGYHGNPVSAKVSGRSASYKKILWVRAFGRAVPRRNVNKDIYCFDLSAVHKAELFQPGLHLALTVFVCERR